MRYYSYIVARDFGFAPNPFGKHCTLATCKPAIRRTAQIGDWVIGTGSKKKGYDGKLIFAMQVTNKVSFDLYWNTPEFKYKKPVINGSLVQMYGDNIYYSDVTKQWCQVNSHHSHEDGSINYVNLNKDTSGKWVIISEYFYYFGIEAPSIPIDFRKEVCAKTQGHIIVDLQPATELISWLGENYTIGRHADPIDFGDRFQRYKGVP